MNKRFSTLLAAFAAITVVSSAQIGDKYVYLKTSSNYLTITKENAAKADSAALKATSGILTKAAKDSALWMPKFVEKMTSGDSVFQFANKATGKNLSFAIKKNGADKYGTMIAAGVDKFVFKNGISGGSGIWAAYGVDSLVSISSTAGELTVGKDLTGAAKFTTEAAGIVTLNAKDLTGRISTMKFNFNGKDGKLFTATELIPSDAPGNTLAKVRFQVVGSEKSTKGTKQAQYITIDTVSYSGSVSAAKFQLDTLVATGSAQYAALSNGGLQNFNVIMDLSNDSISLTTDTLVIFDKTGKYQIVNHGGNTTATYVVGYKDLSGTQVLTIDSVQVVAPLITLSKGTPVKLVGGTGVYSLQFKGTGGNSANNDKYLTGLKSTGNSVYVAAASKYIPSTQFYVKENEDGSYSAQAREGDLSSTAAIATPLFEDEPLFAVDAAKSIYTTEAGDTLVYTKLDVDMTNKYIGYKYYTKEEMSYGAIGFNLSSKAADDIYLTTTDSIIKGAKTTFADALQLRLGAKSNVASDTVAYGAQALGDTLTRVAYSLEKAYDADGRTFYYGATNVRLAKDITAKRFFFVEGANGAEYKVIDAMGDADKMVTMNISTLAVAYAAPTAGQETFFKIEGANAPTYAKVEPGHYNVVNGNEMLTATAKNAAKFLRVNDELKAAATASDFSMFIDSAFVNRGTDNTKYGYYIYKGAKVSVSEATADTIKGSVLAAKGPFKSDAATGDSAIFRAATIIADSLWYDGDLKDGKPVKTALAKNNSIVMFEVQSSGDYAIVQMMAPTKKLAVVNGTVIFTDNVAAQVLTLKASDAPTSNDVIEASSVSVIASEGQITVAGAEGKKMVISNILGQVIANTVISSSNATIAVPAGVVVVAIEGEAAVKAIVK